MVYKEIKDYVVILDGKNGNTIYEFVNGDLVSIEMNVSEIPESNIYAIFLRRPKEGELENIFNEIRRKYNKLEEENIVDLSKRKSPEENYKNS